MLLFQTVHQEGTVLYMSGNEVNPVFNRNTWEPAGKFSSSEDPKWIPVDSGISTCFDLDVCSASSSVLQSFKDSPQPEDGSWDLCLFLFADLNRALCSASQSAFAWMTAPWHQQSKPPWEYSKLSSQKSCTMRKSEGEKPILSVWQGKQGAVLWVDVHPAEKEVAERGFVPFLFQCPLFWGRSVSILLIKNKRSALWQGRRNPRKESEQKK